MGISQHAKWRLAQNWGCVMSPFDLYGKEWREERPQAQKQQLLGLIHSYCMFSQVNPPENNLSDFSRRLFAGKPAKTLAFRVPLPLSSIP